MLLVTDRSLRVTYVSPGLRRLLGARAEDAVGRPIAVLLRPSEELRRRLEVQCAAPSEHRLSLPVVEANGREHDLVARAFTTTETVTFELHEPDPTHEAFTEPLETILDRISDGMMVVDRAWRYTYVNRAAAAYMGKRRAEILGRVVWELFPATVGTAAERAYRVAMDERRPTDIEILSPSFHRWVAVRHYPTESGVVSYFREVHEEHAAREALRASEERFRSVVDNALVGILLTAPDGRIFSANTAACRMVGREEKEIVGGGRAIVVDESDASVGAFIEERRRTGHATGTMCYVRKDGTRFVAEVSSLVFRDASGEERTSMVFRDVTEQRRAERTLEILAESGRVLGASLDLAQTLQALVRLMVPALADVCGIRLVEDGTPRLAALVHRDAEAQAKIADKLAGASPVVDRVVRTGEPELVPVVTEAWALDKTRDETNLALMRILAPKSVLIVPLKIGGRVIGTLDLAYVDETRRFGAEDVPLVRAVAERAALAIDNARKHAEANEARRLRDEVLNVVAHDLRNPLNGINVNATILGRAGADPETVGSIRALVARANRLIQDLLAMSMIEAGKLPLQRENADVAKIVRDVVREHRAIAQESGVELLADVADGLATARLDHHRIVQLLSNLVGNAIKFTPRGGSVRVAAARDGDAILLRVIDTGRGIAREELPFVFDRFWQAAHSRRAGAGLGLAIAKGSHRRMGATSPSRARSVGERRSP